jgi:hypothetical protein
VNVTLSAVPRGHISKETVAPALQRQDTIAAPMPFAHLLEFLQRCAAQGLIVADLTHDHDLAFRLVEADSSNLNGAVSAGSDGIDTGRIMVLPARYVGSGPMPECARFNYPCPKNQ